MAMDDYYRCLQQSLIQVERKERGDWIVWNWRTASWDVRKSKLMIVMWNSLKPGKGKS